MNSDTAARFAPALFVLLWSTGFIGAKWGLPYADPATFLFVRFLVVSLLLAAVVAWLRVPLPRRGADLIHLSISGILVHGVYLGGVFGAISAGVNAGVAALIVGTQPLLTAVMVGPSLGERVSPRQWLGFLAGVVGVYLVVQGKLSLESQQATGLLLCVAALVGISIGTVYQKRFCSAMDLRAGSMVQFVAAGVFVGLFALVFEDREIEWNAQFWFALSWLCVVLSLGAISLLMWLIRRGAASHIASLFYLVPPLVALEAWLLFGETLDRAALAGMAFCAVGVYLVLHSRRAAR
ncbi:MAG: DMT family transporter [Proteobacteria bacterium]|nr:MAG: DMT family transporter [Pseudomonadota bacterium]